MGVDYYKILQVDRSADDDDLKAYRKLAMKWHPIKTLTTRKRLKTNSSKYPRLMMKPTSVEEILTFEIKPGWKKGTKVTFPENRNEKRGVIPADLVFIIGEKPHYVFKRDNNDLIVTQRISLIEALTGYVAQLTNLDGRNLTILINSIISSSYYEVVEGEGMPLPKEPSKKGN